MQEVCYKYKGGTDKLAKLYTDLVPKLFAYYGSNSLNKYHTDLYKQALAFFNKNDMQKQAAELQARVGKWADVLWVPVVARSPDRAKPSPADRRTARRVPCFRGLRWTANSRSTTWGLESMLCPTILP